MKIVLKSLLIGFSLNRLFAQTNLVGNSDPGFESWPASWGGAGLSTASVDTNNPGEGTKSGKLPTVPPGSPWNTLVNTMLVPVTAEKAYMLFVKTRGTLVGGPASFALAELNSSKVVTNYLWKITSGSPDWHSESLTLIPRSDTRYLKVYFLVDAGATSGAAWWDACRVMEVTPNTLTSATTNPFTDDSNLAIDIAPLPVSKFIKTGSVITPASLVPSVKIGQLLLNGILSWKVVTKAAGVSGSPIFQGSMVVSATGLYAWTVDLKSASAWLLPGDYSLVINAANSDQTIVRNACETFSIQ